MAQKYRGKVLVPYSKRKEREAEEAIRCGPFNFHSIPPGSVMPGQRTCLWNWWMMSRHRVLSELMSMNLLKVIFELKQDGLQLKAPKEF